ECGVNKAAYDRLPDDLKLAIRVACQSLHDEVVTEYDYRHAVTLRQLVAQHGVVVREAPRDLLIALGNAAGEVLKELREDQDALTRKIAEAYIAFRNLSAEYMTYSYAGQFNSRALPIRWS
ncbi:MAG: ABC transporter substrate-binding protein, partial [Elioraea tepidiphila]